MAEEISFSKFLEKVKSEFAENGLMLPEDIELIELAHMECMADESPVGEFIQKMVIEYRGNAG